MAPQVRHIESVGASVRLQTGQFITFKIGDWKKLVERDSDESTGWYQKLL